MPPISAQLTLSVNISDPALLWQETYARHEKGLGTTDQSDFEDQFGTEEDPDILACLRLLLVPSDLFATMSIPEGATLNTAKTRITLSDGSSIKLTQFGNSMRP